MATEVMKQESYIQDRHVLVAIDESDVAEKAVLYVGDFLGGISGFRVTLLNILPEPPDDYFKTGNDKREWIEQSRSKAEMTLKRYRELLIQSGFRKDKVSIRVDLSHHLSLSDCILNEQKRLGCCTVVLGRRKISKKEEFIFGSTSSKILHTDKNCAVWVIE